MNLLEEPGAPRPLVTALKVVKIEPLEGKDRIELATVGAEGGWRSVVEKGRLRVGSIVAFHEPESYVPTAGPGARACYAFLAPESKAVPGETPLLEEVELPAGHALEGLVFPVEVRRARVKTKKFNTAKGPVYSQGLIVPMSETGLDLTAKSYRDGEDLTAALGVVQYDPELAKAGSKPPDPTDPRLGAWPSDRLPGIDRTDEVRLQSKPGLLQEFHNRSVVVSYKIDGMSITVAKNFDGSATVCSRNRELLRAEGLPPLPAHEHVLASGLIESLPAGYAVQAELAGPGIQKNRAGFPSARLFVFNVFRRFDDEDAFEELPFKSARGFCRDQRILFVPVVMNGWLLKTKPEDGEEARHSVATFVQLANTQKYGNGFHCEGIVVRPEGTFTSEVLGGKRLSFKVISAAWEAAT